MAHLCEFIEDCEFTKLSVRILHLLGVEGPKTSHPTKYIRYIYNRVVLENAIVRAAAVTALAKFGVGQKDAEVKRSVNVLLTRCLDDTDDEVRDRAALNLRLMTEEDDVATKFVRNDSMFSLPVLEHQLVMYVTNDKRDTFDTPFDLSSIPVVTREQADAEDRTKKINAAMPTIKAPSANATAAEKEGTVNAANNVAATTQRYQSQLQQIPEIAAYGPLLKSSPEVPLTESETEYVVNATKHIFKEHVVLQYDIKNTLAETVLTDVSMVVSISEDEEESQLEDDFIIPIPRLVTDVPATAYVAFKKADGASFVSSSFTNILKFTIKEIDPSTGEPEEQGYDDEYQVEDLELTGADYTIPAFAGSFDEVWEAAKEGEEASETLQLSNVKSIQGMCCRTPEHWE